MRRGKVDPFIANKSELQASAHKYHGLSEVLFYCSWWKLLLLFISHKEIRLCALQLMHHSKPGICRSAFSLKFQEFWFNTPSNKWGIIIWSINRKIKNMMHKTHFIVCSLTSAQPQSLSRLYSVVFFFLFFLSLPANFHFSVSSNQQSFFSNDITDYFALSL